METSKKGENIKVGYSGIPGSYASIAVERIFPDGQPVSYKNFREAYEATVNGECDLAVLPIENSSAGEVGQVVDLMFEGDLYINGVYELAVCHCLLGVEGSSLDTVKTVVSHPQALEQCNEYIYDHNYSILQATNTARAAKKVSEENDVTVAAIASAETARLYGLNIIDTDLCRNSNNTTRFAVFSKKRELGNDEQTSILMFTVKHEAGTLAKAISVLGEFDYNMKVIRSRPLKKENWRYYFYIEVDGDLFLDKSQEMKKELSKVCEMVKVVGTFTPGVKI